MLAIIVIRSGDITEEEGHHIYDTESEGITTGCISLFEFI